MTDKKRNIIALGALGAVACMGIVSAIPLSINTFNPSKADETEYSIIFNSTKNVITTSSTVKSEKGNSFDFSYDNLLPGESVWQYVKPEGYFYTHSNSATDKNAIHGIKTIYFNFQKEGIPFYLLFSRDGSFDEGHYWKDSGHITKAGGETYKINAHPRYFKFEANSTVQQNIGIIDMKITYSCDASADTAWDSKHGINPTVSGNTLTYGLYPQTIVSPTKEPELYSKLKEIAEAESLGAEDYFWYNDEYYCSDKGNPDPSSVSYFSDGMIVEKDKLYFFKCEPIKWNIKGTDEKYTLDCSSILYGHRFAESSKIYAASELRTWLNGDFYRHAFDFNKAPILTTDLSDVEVTGENVWVGSQAEYKNWYSSDSARIKKPTDFALCNCAYIHSYDKVGKYWTRTMDPLLTTFNLVYVVGSDGGVGVHTLSEENVGISPSLTVIKN